MTKEEHHSTLNSCWNKARPDEQLFILLDRDKSMPATIRFWASKRIEMGLNHPDDPQITSALDEALAIEQNT